MSRPRRSRYLSHGASRGHPAEDKERKKIAFAPPADPGSSRKRLGGFARGSRPYDYAAYEREEATPDYLRRLFREHGFDLMDRQFDRFWRFYCLLRDRNAELDLTRIMGIEATVLKHFVDSLMPLRFCEIQGPLLDIGTGPGFPGVPLAIQRPDLPIILAESRGKRVRFLEELKRELRLDNATIYPRSVRRDSPFLPATEPEVHSPGSLVTEAIPSAVHDVISRALETIPDTLDRVRPFLPAGGRAIFLKGPNCGQEVTAAQEGWKGVFRMTADVRYDLPNSRNQHRRLVIFELRSGNPAAEASGPA